MNTGRFLDGPEFTVMHDHGNEENLFDRFDFKPSPKDTINLNFEFTRSWFQTPNSFDAQDATAWSGPVCQLSRLFDHLQRPGPQRPGGRAPGSAFADQDL